MTDIVISNSAKKDIESSLLYIRDVLQNPLAATKLADSIASQIDLLKQHPKSGPKVQDTFLAEQGFRFLLIKNYKLYYIIKTDGTKITILIIRFLFSKMNYEKILKTENL
ncbi:MAG: type II toxin-antitoxin system RelE/ParE family toxin [Treponema sp.]|uniref:type II toxin-antitoxin system RelE/ParE family toxin n=1 Tax=Treponema sp. TaxID=166 RepID=UPI00298D69DE|nr:type II toxin-antitoxin system RelE/ParE family toxin [Treponema sp.]MDD5811034.1 type II toxin-antitoxin system RelE/ParE family toxin [Treponema sp.]